MSAFKAFCVRYGISPLPASELTLRYFCAHLSRTVTYQTLKVYLAGIRLLHIEQGYPEPTANAHLLQYLCTGIRRSRRDAPRVRSPITLHILRTLQRQLGHSDIPAQDKLLYWAAFTLGFFGFLRASEYSAPSHHHHNPTRTLTLRDLSVKHQSLEISLRRSKTDRFGNSATVLVGSTSSSLCPVRAMKRYLIIRRTLPPGPLFIFSQGHFLTRRDVSNTLKKLLGSAGMDPQCYEAHYCSQPTH